LDKKDVHKNNRQRGVKKIKTRDKKDGGGWGVRGDEVCLSVKTGLSF
jgi:hypothetical protein